MSDTINSLAIEARRGQVIEEGGLGAAIQVTHDFAVPSFDFGGLDEPSSGDLLPQTVRDEMWADWIGADSPIHLPFERCIYIFRHRDVDGTESPNLFYLVDAQGVITIDVFWSSHDSWMKHPVTIRYERPTQQLWTDFGIGSPVMFDEDGKKIGGEWEVDAQTNWSKTIFATLLLHQRGTVKEKTDERLLVTANEDRAKTGLEPLPAPIRVHYAGYHRQDDVRHGSGDGSPRSPHDRRAHYRRLKSGKMVEVRACRVHGGLSEGRHYKVTA